LQGPGELGSFLPLLLLLLGLSPRQALFSRFSALELGTYNIGNSAANGLAAADGNVDDALKGEREPVGCMFVVRLGPQSDNNEDNPSL
jgi:hypothetical protein